MTTVSDVLAALGVAAVIDEDETGEVAHVLVRGRHVVVCDEVPARGVVGVCVDTIVDGRIHLEHTSLSSAPELAAFVRVKTTPDPAETVPFSQTPGGVS